MTRALTSWLGRPSHAPVRRPRPRLGVEALEGRDLSSGGPTAQLAAGVLTIAGTAGPDRLTVWHQGERIGVDLGRTADSFAAAAVAEIRVEAGDGRDVVRLNVAPGANTAGRVPPVRVLGGPGNDAVLAHDWPGPAELDGGGGENVIVESRGATVRNRGVPLGPALANPLGVAPALLVPRNPGEGDPRFGSPRRGETGFHQGVDLVAAEGTPVYPVAPGKVHFVSENAEHSGYYLVLRHEGGGGVFFSYYMHLRSKPGLEKGQDVVAGQQIGEVGRTAGVDGKGNPKSVPGQAHLHLMLRPAAPGGHEPDRGRYLVPNLGADPSRLTYDRARPIDGAVLMDPPAEPDVTPDALPSLFDAGVGEARASAAPRALASLGADLPLLSQSLGEAAKADAQFARAFAALPAAPPAATGAARPGVDPDLQSWADALTRAGMAVDRLSTTADDRGDLAVIRYAAEYPVAVTFDAGGKAGIPYLDDNVTYFNGRRLGEGAKLTQTVTVKAEVVYGVDLVGGVPSFYVSDVSKLEVLNFTVTSPVSGRLSIGSLADVAAAGDLTAELSAGLTLTDGGSDGNGYDGRLRPADLAAGVRGRLDGSVGLTNATFKATVPILPEVTWGGTFVVPFGAGGAGKPEVTLTPPDGQGLIRGMVGKLGADLFGGDKLGFLNLGGVGDLLKQKLPVVDKSLAGMIPGFDAVAGLIDTVKGAGAVAGGSLTDLRNALEGVHPGFELLPDYIGANPEKDIDGTPNEITGKEVEAAVSRLIAGDPVRLVTFDTGAELRWDTSASFFLGAAPLPPLPLAVTLTADIEAYVSGGYRFGFGIDTTGFYLARNTGLSVGGGVRGGLTGTASLAGLLGLSVTAGAGIKVGAGLGLNDPDPTDNGVYLDEIFDGTGSLFDQLGKAIRFNVSGEANAFARARLGLPWPLPSLTLFDAEWRVGAFWNAQDQNPAGRPATKRVMPLGSSSGRELPTSLYSFSGGVLSLKGTPTADQAEVSKGPDGSVLVIWAGQGRKTFAGGTRVTFAGGAGNDRLDVDPAFDLPVSADGGAGDDTLTGGAMADALAGGPGRDDLRGWGGADRLLGGDGDDLLAGDAGNDTVDGGTGNDDLAGDAGDDSLLGGDGQDALAGGAGNDVLDGGANGTVRKEIYRPVHEVNPDGSRGKQIDVEKTGVFRDELGGDLLAGGGDNDTLRGMAGNDVLDGGDGADSLDGGTGNDTLAGGEGADVVIGNTGDDRLAGGAGADRLDGGAGNDRLGGDAGDDALEGGAGNDTLRGGAGVDRLNGAAGEDRFEVDFLADQGAVVDALVGGPHTDTIAVVGFDPDPDGRFDAAVTGDDDIVLTQVAAGVGVPAGTFEAGWKPLGSDVARRTVRFTIPADVDNVVILGLGGNDRLEVDPGARFRLQVDGGDGDDTILGGGGQDSLRGGSGNDVIDGRGGDDAVFGEAGNDDVTGGDGSDAVYGGLDDDTVRGGPGRDVGYGGGGNDRLEAGDGGDLMYGEAGADVLVGGAGIDMLDGGAGNDDLTGGAMGDLLVGGAGDDALDGGAGRDLLLGGDGDDVLRAGDVIALNSKNWSNVYKDLLAEEKKLVARAAALDKRLESPTLDPTTRAILAAERLQVDRRIASINDTQTDLLRYQDVVVDRLDGGAGNDTLFGSDLGDLLNGNYGSDTIYHSPAAGSGRAAPIGVDTVMGGTAPDVDDPLRDSDEDVYVVQGTELADVVALTYTSDTGDANVVVNGKPGVVANRLEIESVKVEGLGGDDRITLAGLRQKVPFRTIVLDGGTGNDVLDAGNFLAQQLGLPEGEGYEGHVGLFGSDGNDTLTGGATDDEIDGGIGDDVITGGDGDDFLRGGWAGNDSITGDNGNDTIWGEDGDDTLVGGAGDDGLDGWTGNDWLDGGDGADAFGIGQADDDRLPGFQRGTDAVLLREGGTYTVEVDEAGATWVLRPDGALWGLGGPIAMPAIRYTDKLNGQPGIRYAADGDLWVVSYDGRLIEREDGIEWWQRQDWVVSFTLDGDGNPQVHRAFPAGGGLSHLRYSPGYDVFWSVVDGVTYRDGYRYDSFSYYLRFDTFEVTNDYEPGGDAGDWFLDVSGWGRVLNNAQLNPGVYNFGYWSPQFTTSDGQVNHTYWLREQDQFLFIFWWDKEYPAGSFSRSCGNVLAGGGIDQFWISLGDHNWLQFSIIVDAPAGFYG